MNKGFLLIVVSDERMIQRALDMRLMITKVLGYILIAIPLCIGSIDSPIRFTEAQTPGQLYGV